MRGESRAALPVPVPRSGALGLLAAEEPPAPPAARSPQLAALRSRARASPGLPRRSYPDGNSRAAPTGSPGPQSPASPPAGQAALQDHRTDSDPRPRRRRGDGALRLSGFCFASFILFFFFPHFVLFFLSRTAVRWRLRAPRRG